MSQSLKTWFSELLAQEDIRLDGSRPWDIDLVDENALHRVMSTGSLGNGLSVGVGMALGARLDGSQRHSRPG